MNIKYPMLIWFAGMALVFVLSACDKQWPGTPADDTGADLDDTVDGDEELRRITVYRYSCRQFYGESKFKYIALGCIKF